MKKTSLIFITLFFLLTAVIACGGQPSAPSGGGSSGSSGGSSGGSGQPTSAPARATSAPAQPTNAPAQMADDFAAALTRAFREGDTGYLRSVMEEPFGMGFPNSEYAYIPLNQTFDDMATFGFFEGQMDCRMDDQAVLNFFYRPDVQYDSISDITNTDYAIFCSGYGPDSIGQAIMMVNREGAGEYTLLRMVFYPDGQPPY